MLVGSTGIISPTVQLSGVWIAMAASLVPDVDINLGIPHQQATHSLVACAITVAGCLALSVPFPWLTPWQFAWSLGYLLHVFADAFTDNGVQLLWPWRKGRRKPIYRLWTHDTGAMYELALIIISAAICMGLTVRVVVAMSQALSRSRGG